MRLQVSLINVLTCAVLLLASAAMADQPKILPAGYSVETIKTPVDAHGRPVQFEGGAIDFSADGTAFIATRVAGIWKYKDGKWSLFADGLHDPQGLLVAPDGHSLYVCHKPELTRITDLDGDGVGDLYETINDDWKFAGNYCEYVHGLVRDRHGTFYMTLNLADGNNRSNDRSIPIFKGGGAAMATTLGYDGWAVAVTKDGKFVPWACGLRSPAGIGSNREDEVFFTDNQGGWIGTSTLNHLKKGAFYGYPASMLDLPQYKSEKDLKKEDFEKLRKPPVAWIPHGELANSPGNPQFDETGGKFGPFAGQVFIGDQTRSNIFRASIEKVKGEYQGAVFNFIDHLQSGCIRIRFDGQGRLWTGQTGRGWRSVGGKMEGLQRITWDGKTVPFEMHSMKLTKTGFAIRFTKSVDKASVTGDGAIRFRHWHYHYHGKYGSPKVDVTAVTPQRISVSADRLTVYVDLPLKAGKVFQVMTKDITAEDGSTMTTKTGYYTLNNLLD